jgi:anti-sigma factor RsiW
MAPRHLSAAEMAAHLDGSLSPEDRAAADFHLSACEECRAELIACAQLAANAPAAGRSRSRFGWTSAAAAAAAVLAIVLVRTRGHQAAPAAPAVLERRSAAEAPVQTVAPVNNALIPPTGTRFVWRADAAGTTYRIILTDAAGARVWSRDVPDTSVVLPDSVGLHANQEYYWQVDASRPDGTVIQSQHSAIRIAPR